MSYVAVTTIQTFKHTYFIPVSACNSDDPTIGACDEVTYEGVKEAAQDWIGEQIIDAQVLSESEAIQKFDKESPYLKEWSLDQKREFLDNWQSEE